MHDLDLYKVKTYLKNLQNQLCTALEREDPQAKFHIDDWREGQIIEASTRVLGSGAFLEHAAVNFSHVCGNNLPQAASARYPELVGGKFQAMGVSSIIHPLNPYAPTAHLNIRLFSAESTEGQSIWWFGGGYDLTPYYPFAEDCQYWHRTAHDACAPFGDDIYPLLKQACDKYFFLPHRNETRGVGGLFFDDFNHWPFAKCFAFLQSVGASFIAAYIPILNKRKNTPYGERERDFQLYRRGRYVEFNLLYDRGTLFGLQAKGRTESILASLPPNVKWRYNWQPEPGSAEAELYKYLQPREWVVNEALAR